MGLNLLDSLSLLNMALAGIVGNASSDVTKQLGKQLWQKIKDRLIKNQPTLEENIVQFENNPSQENLKVLEAYLQVEMHQDRQFAEEISKLGKNIDKANIYRDINVKNIKAEDNAVSAFKIEAPNSTIGGLHNHYYLGKN